MTGEHALVVSSREKNNELEDILAGNGLNVTRLETMHQLIGLNHPQKFKIALLDLDLPCVNNSRIYSLKQNNPHIWIIGLSSQAYHPHLKESLREHMFGVLASPPDVRELQYCLTSCLRA